LRPRRYAQRHRHLPELTAIDPGDSPAGQAEATRARQRRVGRRSPPSPPSYDWGRGAAHDGGARAAGGDGARGDAWALGSAALGAQLETRRQAAATPAARALARFKWS
jgi:hypothetical protein